MIKKIVRCALCLVILLLTSTICLAGDVPEGLLMNNTAEVYFGEIKSIEQNTITVIQKQSIKGLFKEGSERIYSDFAFTGNPIVGETYLCGFYDEYNPLYMWEVTSFEPKTLQIKTTDNMSTRMQEYLNTGKFEEKEQERLVALQVSTSIENEVKVVEKPNELEKKNEEDKGIKIEVNKAFMLGAFVVIILRGILIWKRKK